MAIDPYAACPGGTGKKIKFCCPDLTGDLEQIEKLVEGDQTSAALEQVDRLAAKFPGRACLMATQVKLQLATRKFAEAAATSQAFLAAFPDNPLALGHAAVADAIAGRIQEAAAAFDKARDVAGAEVSTDLVRIAATLVQAGAQAGHSGFAQGIVEWMIDNSLGTAEEQRLLAAVVGSAGVPAALRTKARLESPTADATWRADFETGLEHARAWRLGRALTVFRGLKPAAGRSRELFTNIAILCEQLARPFEAAEAWLAVADLPGLDADDAVEATGRAIALETEADEDRSPIVPYERRSATLVQGAEGAATLDLLEDRLRHDEHFEPAPYDRSQWTTRGAVPPRSAWRVFDAVPTGDSPARLLATLLIFGRQTDQEPTATLQGFQPDLAAARSTVESVLGSTFGEPLAATLPATTPTNWLRGAQFRPASTSPPATGVPTGQPAPLDTMLASQSAALWRRFVDHWPDTPLPELLGKTPREAVREPAAARRVVALVNEGEATARSRDETTAWSEIRGRLGIASPDDRGGAAARDRAPAAVAAARLCPGRNRPAAGGARHRPRCRFRAGRGAGRTGTGGPAGRHAGGPLGGLRAARGPGREHRGKARGDRPPARDRQDPEGERRHARRRGTQGAAATRRSDRDRAAARPPATRPRA